MGDFNHDGSNDILMHRDAGGVRALEILTINDNTVVSGTVVAQVGANFQVDGIGDFNGDGTSDIAMQADTYHVLEADPDAQFGPGNFPPAIYNAVFPTMAFAGLEFSQPHLGATDLNTSIVYNQENNSLVIAYGPTYVWFNQYIDPTSANVEKFWALSADGNLAYPADRVDVIDEFGTPAVLLDDDSLQNNGTGQPFIRVGTWTPYTPIPSILVSIPVG